MRFTRKTFLTCLFLYCVAQLFFLIHIQFPRGPSFDEYHYVPSAKQFLELRENQNWEHPPLAKEIMALSIGAWGDRPIGWRFASTMFGALTLVAMYLWGLALFRDPRPAAVVAGLTALNHLLYVQSRIGMLDTFMFAFLAWALCLFTECWMRTEEEEKGMRHLRWHVAIGGLLGLAMASKWMAIVAWATCAGLWILRPVLRPKSEAKLTFLEWAMAYGLVPVFVYFLTFIPYLFVNKVPPTTILDFFPMQAQMLDGQKRVVSQHPYMSQWYEWPLLTRPIWYTFDKEGPAQQWVRGVMLIGNPLIMWGGLVALAYCVWDFLKRKSQASLLIVVFYCAFYFCWMVIPRKIAFYYYYYPAGMVLSLALAQFLENYDGGKRLRERSFTGLVMGLSLAIFIYFFPILSAMKIPIGNFMKWMWFSRWI